MTVARSLLAFRTCSVKPESVLLAMAKYRHAHVKPAAQLVVSVTDA